MISSSTAGVVAVVPVRGGSRGVLRKNLQTVGGVSLLERTLRSVMASRLVSLTVVSSDDPEMLRVAQDLGFPVLDRPAYLATDQASSEAVMRHVIEYICDEVPPESDPLFCMLQVTSPFLDIFALDKAISIVSNGEAESAFSAAEFHGFVWQRSGDSWKEEGFGRHHRLRRQDQNERVIETGSFYVARRGTWMNQGRFGHTVAPVTVDSRYAIEIDSVVDLARARSLRPSWMLEQFARELPALVVTDFDGVLTSDLVIQSESGCESAQVSRRDGAVIRELIERGVHVAVCTRESAGPALARCEKLGIRCLAGIEDKGAAVATLQATLGIAVSDTWVIGNSIHDVPMIQRGGMSFAPSDSWPEFAAAATVIVDAPGGHHVFHSIFSALLSRKSEPPRLGSG